MSSEFPFLGLDDFLFRFLVAGEVCINMLVTTPILGEDSFYVTSVLQVRILFSKKPSRTRFRRHVVCKKIPSHSKLKKNNKTTFVIL